jgi:hypothetical protein
LRVEIRRLQDAGGKEFGIGAEEDDGTDGLRVDAPLGGISGLMKQSGVALAIELFGAKEIAEGVVADNF